MRVDTVPKWEPMDLRQFENETAFLDNFDAQSQRLDSFLNSKGSTGADAKLYETDDHIMTAARAFHDQISGADTSQQIDALRQLVSPSAASQIAILSRCKTWAIFIRSTSSAPGGNSLIAPH